MRGQIIVIIILIFFSFVPSFEISFSFLQVNFEDTCKGFLEVAKVC